MVEDIVAGLLDTTYVASAELWMGMLSYFIKNIMKFTKALRHKPHTLREISSDPSNRITRTM